MNSQQFFTGSISDTLMKYTREQAIHRSTGQMVAEPIKLEKHRKGITSFLHSTASTTRRKQYQHNEK